MTQMRHRVLGTSGIKVSEICLGTMMFGGATDEAEARASSTMLPRAGST